MPITILDIIKNYSYAVYDKQTTENEFKYSDGNIVPMDVEYHIYYTKSKNEYFMTGKKLNFDKSVFIIPIKNKTLFGQYKFARENKMPSVNYLRLDRVIPTDEDYNNGYINRYFAQQSNNEKSKILEITKRNYDLQHDFYKKVSIKWRLTGSTDQVIYSNNKAIELASKIIYYIIQILDNPLQFYKSEITKKDEVLKKLAVFQK